MLWIRLILSFWLMGLSLLADAGELHIDYDFETDEFIITDTPTSKSERAEDSTADFPSEKKRTWKPWQLSEIKAFIAAIREQGLFCEDRSHLRAPGGKEVSWKLIAERVGSKSVKQCQQLWFNRMASKPDEFLKMVFDDNE